MDGIQVYLKLFTKELNLSEPIIDPDEVILAKYTAEEKITSQSEIVFLEETFYGILNFHHIIKVLKVHNTQATLDLFYIKMGERFLKSEFSLFAILVYLGMIRLEELTFARYAKFIRYYDATKMAQLIGFLFDPSNLEKELQPLWFGVLDASYVKVCRDVLNLGININTHEQEYTSSASIIRGIMYKSSIGTSSKEIGKRSNRYI